MDTAPPYFLFVCFLTLCVCVCVCISLFNTYVNIFLHMASHLAGLASAVFSGCVPHLANCQHVIYFFFRGTDKD